MATKSKKVVQETWPKVVQGTHLTVTTYEDGRTELTWDDEQLAKEVREAIASVKKPSVRAKANKKVPEAMKRKPSAITAKSSSSKKKTEADALNAYNDERLVSKHDKIQATAAKKPATKKAVAKKAPAKTVAKKTVEKKAPAKKTTKSKK